MNPLRPVTPDELATLVMENELLRYEVAHLRARLAAATGADPAAPDDEPPASGGEPGADLPAPVRRARAFFSGRHGAGGEPTP